MAASWAAIEAFARTLAGEMGPQGIRVVCLCADGMPENDTVTTVFGLHAKGCRNAFPQRVSGINGKFYIIETAAKII